MVGGEAAGGRGSVAGNTVAASETKYAGPIGPAEVLESAGEPQQIAGDLHRAVEGAFRLARSRGYQHSGVEHLLLTLLDNPVTAVVLAKCGANLALLRDELARSP